MSRWVPSNGPIQFMNFWGMDVPDFEEFDSFLSSQSLFNFDLSSLVPASVSISASNTTSGAKTEAFELTSNSLNFRVSDTFILVRAHSSHVTSKILILISVFQVLRESLPSPQVFSRILLARTHLLATKVVHYSKISRIWCQVTKYGGPVQFVHDETGVSPGFPELALLRRC